MGTSTSLPFSIEGEGRPVGRCQEDSKCSWQLFEGTHKVNGREILGVCT